MGSLINVPEDLALLYIRYSVESQQFDGSLLPKTIYVRQEMLDLWAQLKSGFEKSSRVLISGSPGIGKSVAVALFVYDLVRRKGITIYHLRKVSGAFFLYRISKIDDESVFVSLVMKDFYLDELHRQLRSNIDTHRTYAFVDGVKYDDSHNSDITDIASCFHNIIWCSSAHPCMKGDGAVFPIYGLSPWTLDEMKASVEKQVPEGVDEQQLLLHWYYLGGTMRRLTDDFGARKTFCDYSLSGVKDPRAQLLTSPSPSVKDSVTYTRYNKDRNGICFIASDYYISQLYERMDIQLLGEFLNISKAISRSVYGGVFQAFWEKRISGAVNGDGKADFKWNLRGTKTDESGKVGRNSDSDSNIAWENWTITVRKVDTILSLGQKKKGTERVEEESEIDAVINHIHSAKEGNDFDGVLFVPKYEYFPLADWMILNSDTIYLINATIGKAHAFNSKHYNTLVTVMTPTDRPKNLPILEVRVVYLVPDKEDCSGFSVTGNALATAPAITRLMSISGDQVQEVVHPYVAYCSKD